MFVTKDSTESFARNEAGGKGFNLYLLSREGFAVPSWVVVGVSHFKQFRKDARLDEKILPILRGILDEKARCGSVTSEKLSSAESEIHRLILDAPLQADFETKLRAVIHSFGCEPIAVRSSAADEDSSQHSFAGQLSTFLYVKCEGEALQKLKECWASAYSARSLSYRLQNGLDFGKAIEVAVVFQAMVDCEKSGVLFTCDPIRGRSDQMTVNSVYGIGEGLVSGLLAADTFVVQKESLSGKLANPSGEILAPQIAEKKTKLVQNRSEGSGLVEVSVKSEDVHRASLQESELKTLCELGKKVEQFYRRPQDIEWGLRGGRFFLLQSRPVTTPVQNDEGLLYIWDNSNIVESYGGITLPLTFSFAHHVYHSVYVQFCEILLIPAREIRRMDFFLRNMLGIFDGRIYYNLLNWYKLTSILPGFKFNRSFMETMMGTPHSLSDEIADRIKPPRFQERFASKARRLVSGLKFLYFHFVIQGVVDQFLRYFHSVYREYRKTDFNRLRADECFAVYQELEQKLLLEWKAPILNDYLCMVHFGILKKLTERWLSHLGPSLQNDLLCGEGNLESAEPTRELVRMAAEAKKNPKLCELLLRTEPSHCLEALVQNGFQAFKDRVDRYIDLYGFRCMNEMKLEERDLYQDPSFLFTCLKNYLRGGGMSLDLAAAEKREKEIRSSAERKVFENVRGWKRALYLWSLKNARKAVKNRENTRFCRTRIYGVVRAIFNAIGKDFCGRGILDRPEDVFYLVLNEVSGALEGTLPAYNLRALVEVRKKEYGAYFKKDRPARFLTRGLTYWNQRASFGEEREPQESQCKPGEERLPANVLRGLGCSPGTVEGRVKLILSPQDNLELNREILVTLRTDPGWIPLYPSVSGLLVERGGLLSHSAIVAREMGLPTVVGVEGLVSRLQTGMWVRMNGETGVVEILEEPPTPLEEAPTPSRGVAP